MNEVGGDFSSGGWDDFIIGFTLFAVIPSGAPCCRGPLCWMPSQGKISVRIDSARRIDTVYVVSRR